jgi:hypothetical protein
MSLSYVNNSGAGNCGDYDFSPAAIASLSQSSFTHISIPFTAFTFTTGGCSGYSQTTVDTPFQLLWVVSSSGTTITLDNIQWTY